MCKHGRKNGREYVQFDVQTKWSQKEPKKVKKTESGRLKTSIFLKHETHNMEKAHPSASQDPLGRGSRKELTRKKIWAERGGNLRAQARAKCKNEIASSGHLLSTKSCNRPVDWMTDRAFFAEKESSLFDFCSQYLVGMVSGIKGCKRWRSASGKIWSSWKHVLSKPYKLFWTAIILCNWVCVK